MLRTLSILAAIACLTLNAAGQTPLENKVLNYRKVGFTAPELRNTRQFTLQVARGHYNSEEEFRQNILFTKKSITPKIPGEVPAFGAQYTWRILYQLADTVVAGSFYHFSTGTSAAIDTSGTRLRITHKTTKYPDTYVLPDNNRVMYDMQGQPVWYLPAVEGKERPVRDLKLTKAGTITFMAEEDIYEVDYDGNILWKGPNNGTVSGENTEHYHHEFTRLGNGHYMVLGKELVSLPSDGAGKGISADAERVKNRIVPSGTIIEYDAAGNVVWSWKTSSFFDLNNQTNDVPDINFNDIHENSFYFDENAGVIYLSCKGLNTILKVKYPEGTVLSSYGEAPLPGTTQKRDRIFCGQHNVSTSEKGCVFIYNNNGCGGTGPKVKLLQQPLTSKECPKIVWEYACSTDGKNGNMFLSGGSVAELPGGDILVCMGGSYGKVFLVSKNKAVLWSALPEIKKEGKWEVLSQYRCSVIKNNEEFSALLWPEHKQTSGGNMQVYLTENNNYGWRWGLKALKTGAAQRNAK